MGRGCGLTTGSASPSCFIQTSYLSCNGIHKSPEQQIHPPVNMDFKLTVMLFASALAYCQCSWLPKAGGLSDADDNDATIQQMANFAISEIGTEYSLEEITKAQTQVVAGKLYHLKLLTTRVSQTNGSSKQYSCKVKVLSQSWLGVLDLTEFKCSNVV